MKNVLLIEDEESLAAVIRRELESHQFHVNHANNGERGLEMFQENTPDLVILDWMLPEKNGISVLREIRRHSLIPVLMLTARGDEIDRVLGLELGADDYMTKPFGMRELIARVNALLRRIEHVDKIRSQDKQQNEDELEYAGLKVNKHTFQVIYNGEPLDLTPIEFNLLYLFLKNPLRVFSRRYLLEAVWESDYLPGDRSVDNAITRLRKKLKGFGKHIESVWGVGYKLGRPE